MIENECSFLILVDYLDALNLNKVVSLFLNPFSCLLKNNKIKCYIEIIKIIDYLCFS